MAAELHVIVEFLEHKLTKVLPASFASEKALLLAEIAVQGEVGASKEVPKAYDVFWEYLAAGDQGLPIIQSLELAAIVATGGLGATQEAEQALWFLSQSERGNPSTRLRAAELAASLASSGAGAFRRFEERLEQSDWRVRDDPAGVQRIISSLSRFSLRDLKRITTPMANRRSAP